MPNAKFILRDKYTVNETLIVLFFHFKKYRLSYSTKISINPDQWDFDKQRAKTKNVSGINVEKNKDINYKLLQIKNDIESTYNEYEFNRITPSIDELKCALNRKQNRIDHSEITEVPEIVTLEKYIDIYINSIEKKERLTFNGKQFQKGSISTFKSFKNHFANYCIKKKKRYDFNDINLSFYTDFVLYLTNKEFAPNTIGKQVKTLKTILNAAIIDGFNKNLEYKNRGFKILEEESYQIYLTMDELEQLWNLDLSENSTYEKTRDLFLIGAYTALRYSDYSNIISDNITTIGKKRCFTIYPQKSPHKVIIPLKSIVVEILEKYNYNLPSPISNQKSNEYLKLIGEMAKIDSKETFPNTRGGNSKMVTKPKHEMITTHTARRSAATNMYKEGFKAFEIMLITGHKTESEFFKYIKISQEENAIKLSEHSYYN